MELVSLALEGLQNMAELAASYRLGQAVLRQLDRALWVYEKCARWAVPPPLDADERPQPELVRPLPWILFLMMLVVLRVSRESISLLNLARGKPPLRSADVVTFFQSKRRYLRTLKYQGARVMRARSAAPRPAWWAACYRLCELTMCFRRESAYGNNNSTRVSNNHEVMVVKRSKHGGQDGSPASADDSMERLIDRMMADLDAASDDDACYTLTNATNPKSPASDATVSDVTLKNRTPTKANGSLNADDIHFSPGNNMSSSTPEREDRHNNHVDTRNSLSDPDSTPKKEVNRELEDTNISGIPNTGKSQIDKFRENLNMGSPTSSEYATCDEDSPQRKLTTKQASENLIKRERETCDEDSPQKKLSTKQASENLIERERERKPKKDSKIANGRTAKSVPNKKKGPHRDRLVSSELPSSRVLTSNNSF